MVYFGVFLVLTDSVQLSTFYAKIPYFMPVSFLCLFTFVCRLCMSSVGGALMLSDQGEGWYMRLGKKRYNFVQVGAKLFWPAIYCTNPKPKPESQSSYLSRKGLRRRFLQIIQ